MFVYFIYFSCFMQADRCTFLVMVVEVFVGENFGEMIYMYLEKDMTISENT